MGRFASTVPFYADSRPPYGAAFFCEVAHRLDFKGRERLLDLGTGPGLVALGFAPYVAEAVGLDPEPVMLAAARRAAEAAGLALRLIEGRAETLPEDIGRFDVVTIGRALHWMDPEPTRACLTRCVAEPGCVLICRASSVEDSRNPWLSAYEAARRPWTLDAPRMLRHQEQDSFFDGTVFHRDAPVLVETEHVVPVETLVNRVFSMSSSSPALVGERADMLREQVRDALCPFTRDGLLRETVVTRADIFRKAA